jgi:hypothetical protein
VFLVVATLSTGGRVSASLAPFFVWPASGLITQTPDEHHQPPSLGGEGQWAVDIGSIGGAADSPVLAAYDGTVAYQGVDFLTPSSFCKNADGTPYTPPAGQGYGYGNFVTLNHTGGTKASGYFTTYGHLDKILVTTGEHVFQGQIIGLMGTTGCSSGNHVHFEIGLGSLANGEFVSPAESLWNWNGTPVYRGMPVTAGQPIVQGVYPGLGGTYPSGPIDLVFAIDTTASMTPYIDAVKSAATTIATNLLNSSDARIGVVDYRDFYTCPDDLYAFKVDLPFAPPETSINPMTVTDAINGLTIGDGCDIPESVYSGVMTAIGFPWRSGVKKAIIVMGDAPPHDPEPVTGFTLASVLSAARAVDPANIYTIDINAGGGQPFADLAAGSAGAVYSAASPADAVNAILAAITTIITTPTTGSPPCTPANNCFFTTPAPSPSPSPSPTLTPTPVVLPQLSISTKSALGFNASSGYSTKSLKVQAKGKYVTWKFTGGAALAGQRVNILISTATKPGTWSPWKPLTVRVADATGSVTFWWKSSKATSISIRAEWVGNATYGDSLSPARGVIWH